MTQQMDYTGTITTKRLKNTGFTEDVLRQAHSRPGRRIMAIVELCVSDAHNKHDAPNHVDFTIEQAVPFLEDSEDDFLRRMTKSAHQARVLNSDGEQLSIETGDDVEPSVEKIIAAREAETDPYQYMHAKGGRGEPGAETPCGLHASFDKNLNTHVDVDKIDCPECLAILAEENDGADAATDPAEEPAGHALPVG